MPEKYTNGKVPQVKSSKYKDLGNLDIMGTNGVVPQSKSKDIASGGGKVKKEPDYKNGVVPQVSDAELKGLTTVHSYEGPQTDVRFWNGKNELDTYDKLDKLSKIVQESIETDNDVKQLLEDHYKDTTQSQDDLLSFLIGSQTNDVETTRKKMMTETSFSSISDKNPDHKDEGDIFASSDYPYDKVKKDLDDNKFSLFEEDDSDVNGLGQDVDGEGQGDSSGIEENPDNTDMPTGSEEETIVTGDEEAGCGGCPADNEQQEPVGDETTTGGQDENIPEGEEGKDEELFLSEAFPFGGQDEGNNDNSESNTLDTNLLKQTPLGNEVSGYMIDENDTAMDDALLNGEDRKELEPGQDSSTFDTVSMGGSGTDSFFTQESLDTADEFNDQSLQTLGNDAWLNSLLESADENKEDDLDKFLYTEDSNAQDVPDDLFDNDRNNGNVQTNSAGIDEEMPVGDNEEGDGFEDLFLTEAEKKKQASASKKKALQKAKVKRDRALKEYEAAKKEYIRIEKTLKESFGGLSVDTSMQEAALQYWLNEAHKYNKVLENEVKGLEDQMHDMDERNGWHDGEEIGEINGEKVHAWDQGEAEEFILSEAKKVKAVIKKKEEAKKKKEEESKKKKEEEDAKKKKEAKDKKKNKLEESEDYSGLFEDDKDEQVVVPGLPTDEDGDAKVGNEGAFITESAIFEDRYKTDEVAINELIANISVFDE